MANQTAVQSVLDSTVPVLEISFGNEKVVNGSFIGRAEATLAPSLVWPDAATDSTKKYLHINIDLDAPFQSFSILAPILHFLQKDIVIGANGALETSSAPLVDWIKPGPPPGSGPHRYVSLLYEQPDGFNSDGSIIPEGGMARIARMRFDLGGFEKKGGLGKPVAGAWFSSK
jgi:phosphatidylethanolamine-binding protein (PEBP) family uncharacterized protein